jgi:MFS family permease
MWMGSFASFMAMNMQMITRGWLVLRLQDDSPLALALVMVSFAAPMTFMSLVGGALADRFPRKYLIMFSQAGSAVLTFMLAMLDASGIIWFGALLWIGVINGSLMAINMPSRQAIISEIVPEDKLMNAVALNNSAMNLTRIIGPALAGLLIVFIDTSGVFYIVSATYVFSTISVLGVKSGMTSASKSKKSITGDITEGLKYALGNQTLRGLVSMAFVPAIFGFLLFALLPAWAREALNVRSTDLGILMMFMGVGALVGTMGLASIKKFNRRGMLLLVSNVVWGLAIIAMSQSVSHLMAMPFLVMIGLLSSITMSLNMTLTQVYSAPEMRGRVMSLNMMTFGLMPLGALPFGYFAEFIGTANALTISGIALAAISLAFGLLYTPFRRIE